jgi:hypothetical protein
MTQERKNHLNPLTSRKPATVDQSAGDHSPEALAAAHHNWLLCKADWCRCKGNNDLSRTAYYRNKRSGQHGWLCIVCRGIVQTG